MDEVDPEAEITTSQAIAICADLHIDGGDDIVRTADPDGVGMLQLKTLWTHLLPDMCRRSSINKEELEGSSDIGSSFYLINLEVFLKYDPQLTGFVSLNAYVQAAIDLVHKRNDVMRRLDREEHVHVLNVPVIVENVLDQLRRAFELRGESVFGDGFDKQQFYLELDEVKDEFLKLAKHNTTDDESKALEPDLLVEASLMAAPAAAHLAASDGHFNCNSSATMSLQILSVTGDSWEIVLDQGSLLADLKAKLQVAAGAAISKQTLILDGSVLDDNQLLLFSVGIEDGSVLTLAINPGITVDYWKLQHES